MIRNSIAGAVSSLVARPVNGAKLSFEIAMKKLFANGEQGFFYDPNDLSTMFQDAAGTVPVTGVGQPVGLMLDKGKGLVLGSERINGGDFTNGLIGVITEGDGSASAWEINNTSPISGISDGKLSVTTPATFRPFLSFSNNAPKVAGALYTVSFDYKVLSGSPVVGLVSTGGGSAVLNKPISGSGRFTYTYVTKGTGAAETIYFSAVSAYSLQIDNISCKQVLGNHAYQTTSAARPILRDTPRRIDFDAVDDKLITDLPAQLTGCTVIRSVLNVGTQILTGQTIPATYEDNTDHCGLIVINRALTPSETSAITYEFNKRAGV